MSKKDAYYFSHDSNAKDDFKCMLLIEEIGLEGYGIFWILVETLREQESYKYPLKLLPSLARKYNTTLAKMRVVVLNYGLFMLVANFNRGRVIIKDGESSKKSLIQVPFISEQQHLSIVKSFNYLK